MFYISFEIETTVDIDEVDDIHKKVISLGDFVRKNIQFHMDKAWFFKVYEDISCGAEFVTLPMPMASLTDKEEIIRVANDVYKVMEYIRKKYNIRKGEHDESLGYISTHITYTTSPDRSNKMPPELIRNVVQNMIVWYFPIVYYVSKQTIYPYTRGTYFRRYHSVADYYMSDKTYYGALFIPDYDYNDLPPYHKIEFRIPDTLLFSSPKQIAKVLNLFGHLMVKQYPAKDSYEKRLFVELNKTFFFNLNEKELFRLDREIANVSKYAFQYFLKRFEEVVLNDIRNI